MTLAGRLARLRGVVSPEMSARELARLAELSPSMVSFIESGSIRNPKLGTLRGIAGVLGCSLDWLSAGDGNEPSSRAVNEAVRAARAANRRAS